MTERTTTGETACEDLGQWRPQAQYPVRKTWSRLTGKHFIQLVN